MFVITENIMKRPVQILNIFPQTISSTPEIRHFSSSPYQTLWQGSSVCAKQSGIHCTVEWPSRISIRVINSLTFYCGTRLQVTERVIVRLRTKRSHVIHFSTQHNKILCTTVWLTLNKLHKRVGGILQWMVESVGPITFVDNNISF